MGCRAQCLGNKASNPGEVVVGGEFGVVGDKMELGEEAPAIFSKLKAPGQVTGNPVLGSCANVIGAQPPAGFD